MQAQRVLDLAAGCGPRIRQRQRGLSMVELSLVLIVVAILLAAVYWGFSEFQRRAEVTENIAAINEIVGAVQSKFIRTKNIHSLSTATAVRVGVIPARLRISGTSAAENSYGGNINLYYVVGGCYIGDVDCTAHPYARLEWGGVPSSQCVDIVLGVWHSMNSITIMPNIVKHKSYGGLPLTLVTNRCNSSSSAMIMFEFGDGGIGKGG